MKEENYLKQAYGTETPFKVPEGYFDDFATRMMEMLPEQEAKVVEMKPSVWLRWRPYVAAASICAVICGSALFYFGQQNTEQTTAHSGMNTPATEISMEQAADYVMIDNDDIYNYLADY